MGDKLHSHPLQFCKWEILVLTTLHGCAEVEKQLSRAEAQCLRLGQKSWWRLSLGHEAGALPLATVIECAPVRCCVFLCTLFDCLCIYIYMYIHVSICVCTYCSLLLYM